MSTSPRAISSASIPFRASPTRSPANAAVASSSCRWIDRRLDCLPSREEAKRVVPPDSAPNHVAEHDCPDPLDREGVVDRDRASGRPRLLDARCGPVQEFLTDRAGVVVAQCVSFHHGSTNQRRELHRREVVPQDQVPVADSHAVEHQHLLSELRGDRVHDQHGRIGRGDGVEERGEPLRVARRFEERDRDLALLEVVERDVARGPGLPQVLRIPGRRQDRHVQVRHRYMNGLPCHSD